MTDLNKKQAFWAEQLPAFKEKYWIPEHLDVLEFNMDGGCFEIPVDVKTDLSEDDLFDIYHRVNTGWAMWKKAVSFMQEKSKAQAVPEWISVDDKWPEYGQSILVVINGLTQTRVFYRDGSDCSEDWIEPVNDEDKNNIWWNKVTFWMPLPKAPSKSGAEG